MLGWTKAWNHILREVIFKDYDLRKLMKLPKNTGIIQFTERYFVKAGYSNALLTDEVCRIVYSDVKVNDTEVSNVKKNIMTFDIFVKTTELRNTGDDGLLLRTDLIAERLFKLLRKQRYLEDTGFRFWPAGDWDLKPKTAGYSGRTVAFYYMKVY